jgi:hypothetical protein
LSERSDSLELVLLGTGGGRFATITQKRRTGGIRILNDKVNIHLDPYLGMQMIFKGPANEAKLIQQKTGIRTVAASDNMRIIVAEKISVQTRRALDKKAYEFAES